VAALTQDKKLKEMIAIHVEIMEKTFGLNFL